MRFYRTGTNAVHTMSAERLRAFLTAVIEAAEPSQERPVPMIEFPSGFFVSFTTTKDDLPRLDT